MNNKNFEIPRCAVDAQLLRIVGVPAKLLSNFFLSFFCHGKLEKNVYIGSPAVVWQARSQ